MWRLAMTVIATAVLMAFALVNTHHVELNFLVGEPVHIRMIFLLLTAFGAGALCTILVQQLLAIKQKQRAREAAETATRDLVEL